MDKSNILIGETYYKAMGRKDIAAMEKYLHPDVQFIGPMAEMKGRDSLLEAATAFFSFFSDLSIRASFSSGNRVMLAYDIQCAEPIGLYRAAALLTIEDGLITVLELYYDSHPFQMYKEEISS